jgi:GTP-binding protein
VDTAGVNGERLDVYASQRSDKYMTHNMMQQTLTAAKQADVIFLLFDARVGVTSDMIQTVRWLRKALPHKDGPSSWQQDKTVVLLANKLEGDNWDQEGSVILDHLNEATRVGFGEPIPISAQHGEGMAEIAVIVDQLTAQKQRHLERIGNDNVSPETSYADTDLPDRPLQLAILGRQNVGKSTLLNAILNEERVIVGSTPGLTRDAIAVEWAWEGRPVQLVDTAGIRRRSKREHDDDIEDMAVEDAMRAMKVADVAVLVIDADSRQLHRQELAIADAVLKEGRALVVAANKMDLIVEQGYSKEDFEQGVREQLEGRFPMLRKTPIVPMSSLTGDCVHDLLPVVFRARERWEQKITTGQLNRWLSDVASGRRPPRVSGREARIKYIMQTKGRPPTFLLFCNSETLPDDYTRYLTRHFQDTFEMFGMEIRMAVKKSAVTNPYESTRKRRGSGLGGKEAQLKRLVSVRKTGQASRRRRDGR